MKGILACMSTIQLSLFIEPTKHSVRPESALQSHVTLIRFMIAVHIFSISESTVCQNGAFWWMNAVWDLQSEEFFNYFKRVVCHAVLLVNSDLISLEFTVFSVNIFFHFLLISIVFFPKLFLRQFFFNCHLFSPITCPYFDHWVKKYATAFHTTFTCK